MLKPAKLKIVLVFALLFSILTPSSASAAPLAPGFESVSLGLIADNDFAAWMGDDKNVTRLFWQNNVSWYSQVAAMANEDVVPQLGETYIYVLAMGGDGYTGNAGQGGDDGHCRRGQGKAAPARYRGLKLFQHLAHGPEHPGRVGHQGQSGALHTVLFQRRARDF